MSEKLDLSNTTTYLFDCNFFDDSFDPEDHEDHLALSEQLLESYSWDEVFNSWNKYLHSNCKTPEKIINFCNLFMYYGGQDHFIQNPYDFLGYIYSVVDIEKYWDEAGDLIDGLCISVLEKAGEVSTTKNPYYQSWKDPKILDAAEKYKK